jgi:hypothetical protein
MISGVPLRSVARRSPSFGLLWAACQRLPAFVDAEAVDIVQIIVVELVVQVFFVKETCSVFDVFVVVPARRSS